ncbi:hypothetical protein MNBD_GAMMA22-1324 [hydrothermal vent metagenome]|uniref:Inner membrane protein YjeT (Clustered with HflC) n=1 Tax=hydrothermal vent metagenome TaxID=652676 RepID=A0A3B1AB32_9ZZZZ
MWANILIAVALVMVIEGFMPAINPELFRKTMLAVTNMSDKHLRIMGISSMTVGAILVYLFTS